MKRELKNKILFYLIAIFLFISCSASRKTFDNDASSNTQTSFLAGGSFGGIVENNQLSGIDEASGIDAISGATRKSVSLGIHAEFNINGRKIETGLDYLNFDQSIKYNLPSYSYMGVREISFHQLRLPFTYNFELIEDNKLSLKIGASIGYTIYKSIENIGTLPPYQFKNFDYGGTIGVTYFPIKNFGIFGDIYRGSQIYNDVFHTAKGMGGQSYVKFGIIISP
ncbi:hypothetical protein MNBD_IGNAVI01-3064 [hydrothermal vent metagenome]|uniref:Outer membrane protein beta-barrel domain-containing protein n=1 Tax=hydrothermal vent metagenome TaxID=652676 RepID=A0A3B1BXA3_9ZZZZ